MKETTPEENAVLGYINDLVDEMERVDMFFREAPIDYTDRKQMWNDFLIKVGKRYWLN